jgi:ubiquinone/menaquinone biosynthesis C-methylase UbiE
MAYRVDPERIELAILKRAAEWRERRVLDIGCGDGRLTLRLARLGAIVHGLDPDRQLLRQARRSVPPGLAGRICFRAGHAERLRFPDGAFDRVVYSWSL